VVNTNGAWKEGLCDGEFLFPYGRGSFPDERSFTTEYRLKEKKFLRHQRAGVKPGELERIKISSRRDLP
jgi:hypothetical protein